MKRPDDRETSEPARVKQRGPGLCKLRVAVRVQHDVTPARAQSPLQRVHVPSPGKGRQSSCLPKHTFCKPGGRGHAMRAFVRLTPAQPFPGKSAPLLGCGWGLPCNVSQPTSPCLTPMPFSAHPCQPTLLSSPLSAHPSQLHRLTSSPPVAAGGCFASCGSSISTSRMSSAAKYALSARGRPGAASRRVSRPLARPAASRDAASRAASCAASARASSSRALRCTCFHRQRQGCMISLA